MWAFMPSSTWRSGGKPSRAAAPNATAQGSDGRRPASTVSSASR